ncbi:MAG: lipid-transfer protein [Dehalococcoidia bacterium]
MSNISRKAAIVGIGTSEFSRDSGRTELRMVCECLKEAMDDAGLVPADIDGIVKHTDESPDEQAVVSSMGMENLAYFGECRWDGAPGGMVLRAAIGVATGMANYVAVYRAVNGSSGLRQGTSSRDMDQMSTGDILQYSFHAPFGHSSEPGRVAMTVQRYMHEFGIEADSFGWVPVVCREHGAKNPNGRYFDKPLSFDDYRQSEMIVDPLRRMDCYEPADAAVAFIVTTAEKARDLRQKPACIIGAAQSSVSGTEEKNGFYRPGITGLPEVSNVGKRLFSMAGIRPQDIDVAQLDDAYGPFVPLQLEALGFCDPGEGADFCAGGKRIRLGGQLPLNTSGGSLGEGYLYGMNHVIEAVRQIRGISTAQVDGARLALVATGAGGPASGLIIGDSV